MREISLNIKHRVVKQFLNGSSYDEIARQVGIAKGSVVNIVNEFREGHLQVPRDLTEYVDVLRQIAVDLRKSNTSIARVQSCLKLDLKLSEMGVSSEKVEDWLDICHDVASQSASTDRFVAAALELSQASSETGLSYGDVLDDYNARLSKSRELTKEIERKEQQLAEARASHQEQKEQATRELDTMTSAITTAQDMFRKQKEYLKARMNEHLAQNKLSWKKVDTTTALLDGELGRAGMTRADMKRLSKRVRDAKSLAKAIKGLEKEKKGLQADVYRLAQKNRETAASVEELQNAIDSLETSMFQKSTEVFELNKGLVLKMAEYERLQKAASQITDNLYVTHLILGFLFAPEGIDDDDLDRLVSLMIGLRQKRLGVGPKRAKDRDGKVICECQVPRIYGDVSMDESDIDEVREKFAHLLTPLVKDKFISRFDYDVREMSHKVDILQATVDERNRHLL
jgi:hypothetical protein